MNFTYSFTAKSSTSQTSSMSGQRMKPVTGLVVAENILFAQAKVRKLGFNKSIVRLSPYLSLKNGLGYFSKEDFDLREKARFYETISKRIRLGSTFVDSLDSAKEYVDDERLASAILIASTLAVSGQKTWEAMKAAGFTHRDVMVIKALEQTGDMVKGFADLAQEAKARFQSQKMIKAALRMPKIMGSIFYLMVPVFFEFLGPGMQDFFKKLGGTIKMPPDIEAIYGLVNLVNQSPLMWAIAWGLVGIGLVALLRSRLWERLKSHIKTFADLDMKSEHAQLWSVYALMYAANIAPQEICTILRPACKLMATSEGMTIMSRRLAQGSDEVSALEAAGFPRWVQTGFKAAMASGDLPAGLRSFCELLNEDVQILSEKAQNLMQLLAMAMGVVVILFFFYLTYYPIAGVAFKSL